jgi:VanZ family protein
MALGAYWGVLFMLTHIPHVPPPPGELNDKGSHFLGYGGLAGAMFIAAWANWPRATGLWWKVLIACAAYGAVDEWLQALPFIRRDCELNDWFADVGGTLVAVTVLGIVHRVVSKRATAAKMPA